MRNIFFIIFLSVITFSKSQTNRFIYELKYKIDSLQKDSYTDYFILDINKNNVKFYKKDFLDIDSTNTLYNEDTKITLPLGMLLLNKRNINNWDTNTNYCFVGENYYSFISIDKINWKITKEVKNFENYKVQKATTKFGKRNWTAWFSKDIVFQEGPYKFRGLPGLIFEIYDDKENYHFTLKKNTKLKNEIDTSNFLESNFGTKPLLVDFSKYVKLSKYHYNNLFSNLKSLEEGTWNIESSDGSIIKTKNELRNKIKSEQERIIKNNNPIELDKAINYESK